MKKLPLFLLLCITGMQVAAQTVQPQPKKKEMNVDMPDETEETDLVEPGQLQLETAVLYNRYSDSRPSLIGQGLLRYGLSSRIEVRAIAEDGLRRDQYLTETVQATSPLALGTKIVLLRDKEVLPDVTFVGYVTLPVTARNNAERIYWSPVFLLAFQHKFAGEKIKLEYNAGIQEQAFSADWQWLGNASVHYKLTGSLESFVEYYAQYSSRESPSHNLGGGLALEIGERVELYVSGGSSINTSARNYFFAGGIAVRTP